MFSIENGNDCRIRTEKYLSDALKYVETDKNAKEIFEFNDEDAECLACVWKRHGGSKCPTCGTDMIHSDTNSDDNYVEYEFICPKCNTTACFKV